MKKRDIWISITIIIAAAILLSLSYFREKGQIEIDAGGAGAVMRLRSSIFGLKTVSSGNGPAKINAQVYRPRLLRISMQKDSRIWKIDSRGPWGSLSKINIKKNQTTSLRLGPPLFIEPIVSRNGSSVSIGFSIIGQAGERYQANSTGFEPTIKIIDEASNVLASGKFAYG